MDKQFLDETLDAQARGKLLSALEDFLSVVESTFSAGFLDIFPGYEGFCDMRDDLYDLMPDSIEPGSYKKARGILADE